MLEFSGITFWNLRKQQYHGLMWPTLDWVGRGCAQRRLFSKAIIQSSSWGTLIVLHRKHYGGCVSAHWGICVQSPLQGGSASSSQKRFNFHLPDKSSLCEEEPSSHRVNASICQREQWWRDPHRKSVPHHAQPSQNSQTSDAKSPVQTRPHKKRGGSQETRSISHALKGIWGCCHWGDTGINMCESSVYSACSWYHRQIVLTNRRHIHRNPSVISLNLGMRHQHLPVTT